MSSPPSYTNQVDRKHDRLPPYRASHTFANSKEELAALHDFAQRKLYVEPGSDGTLPDLHVGGWGLRSLAWGGPMEGKAPGESKWPAPETEEAKKQRKEQERLVKKEEKARKGSVGERLKRVISGGNGKEAGSGS